MHLLLIFLVCASGLEAALGFATSKYNTASNKTKTTTDHTIMKFGPFAKPGCQSHCGDLSVPYPFGIKPEGTGDPYCSINSGFDITCNTSTIPHKAFINYGNTIINIFDISDTELRVGNVVAEYCYDQGSLNRSSPVSFDLRGTTYTFSDANVFTVVGCDDRGNIYQAPDDFLPKGCITTCHNAEEVPNNQCLGTGCCQLSVNVLKYYDVYLESYRNHGSDRNDTKNISSFNPCGYAFLGEKNKFSFGGLSDLNYNDTAFRNTIQSNVPVVLDWVIEENKSCAQAAQDSDSFACIYANSSCTDSGENSAGYRCKCNQGYEGNPYLSPGCKDTDECADQSLNDCEMTCTNIPGNYICSCPRGYEGDGRKTGSGCIAKTSKFPATKFILGLTFSCISLIIGINWLYCIYKKRKHTQLREKFFRQNGGLLLKQQSISNEGVRIESTKLFTDEELKKATNNYASDRILGQGGYGIVFKGLLPDQHVVAIKRSRLK